VKTEADVMARAKEGPVLIILDLNCNSVETVDVAVKLKAEFKAIPLIAFVSHVQGELKQKAQEAGIDMVLARSAFSQNLPQLLKRYSGTY
jgi:CheY-like chemotaxis protein